MNQRIWLPLLALLTALGYLTLDSAQRWRTLEFVNLTPARVDSPVPEVDSTSPTGYRWSQHDRILPFYVDCYNWIQQTQLMLAGGGWRIREVGYDRVPEGREVHWSGSYRWWLALLAWVDHEYNGTPMPMAVERVAPLASPVLLGCAVLLLVPLVAWRFGGASGALCGLALVTVYDFYQNFLMGNADHHGMVALCCMATVLCLAAGGAGWIRSDAAGEDGSDPLRRWLPSRRIARRWFVVSAVAGGTGLWISAATIVPVLLAVGVGAVLATGWLARKQRDSETAGCVADPSLWLGWGVTGAGVSLFYYVLEYFPSHLGWRLEVNHPLYALAWLGGAGVIWFASRAFSGGSPLAGRRDWLWLGGCLLALVALPLTIWLTHERTFYVADTFLWALHVNYISEFETLPRYLSEMHWRAAISSVSLLPLVALPLLFLVFDAKVFRPLRAMILMVLPAGLLMTLLGVKQVRWLGIADAVWIAGLVIWVWAISAPGTRFEWTRRRRVLLFVFAAVLFVPHPLQASRNWFRAPSPGPADYFQAVARDVAHWLRQRVGAAPVTVLSGPSTGSMLVYHGGFRAEGTLYWENIGGLKDAAAIFSAPTPADARTLIQRHGINYIVIISWDAFAEEYTRLTKEAGKGSAAPDSAFMQQIMRSRRLPKWLRPLPYPSGELPRMKMAKDFFLGVFEVVPDQTDAEAGVRNAQYLIAIGDPRAARPHLEIALRAEPDYLPALITLGRLQFAGATPGERRALLERIGRQLPLAGPLDLGDRIDLAVLLHANGDAREAGRQLAACWAAADERGLRQLRPDAGFALLDLTRRLGLSYPPELQALTVSLLPAEFRARLLFEAALAKHITGALPEAVGLYRQALAIQPDYDSALNNLAMILAASRDPALRSGGEAVDFARRAARLGNYQQPSSLDTLACAHAEAGDFKRALYFGRRALALAQAQNDAAQAADIRGHLALFEAGRPYHEAAVGP